MTKGNKGGIKMRPHKLRLRQYSKAQLETWRTSRLGATYITIYRLLDKCPDEGPSQLELLTEALHARPLSERNKVYVELCNDLLRADQRKDEEDFKATLAILRHYFKSVLD